MTNAPNNNIAALLGILKPEIAEPLSDANSSPIIDKQSAQQWLEGLSTTDYTDNAVQLYRVLPAIVKYACAAETKLEILDSLAPVVIKATEYLLQNQLNQKTAKAISLGHALIRQLLEGYKLVVFQLGQSLPREPGPESQKSVLTIAGGLLNSCHLLARIQLNSLIHYLQQPSYFWRDLHTIYLLAEQLGVVNKELPNNLGISISVKKLYVKILLFSTARPHHFSNYELRFVYTELEFWASFAELRRDGEKGLFSIDPSTDQGAVYSNKDNCRPGNLILDTSQLVSFLQQIISQNSDTLFSDRVSRRVIKDLIRQWSQKLTRRETHIKDQAQVFLTQGFAATLCMLSKTDSFENFLALCGQQPPLKEYQGNGIKRADDVWGPIATSVDRHPGEPVIFIPTKSRGPKHKVVQALRSNVSLNGACIELSDKNTQLQPGELVAVRTRESNKWMAGIVRWKHISPSLYTMCGVQFPARYCAPAAIRITLRGANAGYQFMQAILLSPKRDLSEGVTLLCPPLRYTKNRILVITPLQQTEAILEEELETTEHLSHFKISFC